MKNHVMIEEIFKMNKNKYKKTTTASVSTELFLEYDIL